jgi:formate dehydrogenase major subunit
VVRSNPPVEEPDEKNVGVKDRPKDWAAGMPGVYYSMKPALEHMGVDRTRKTLLALNQKDGFDCPSCAWPDPEPPQGLRVLRKRGEGRHLGGHARRHRQRLLGRAFAQRPARAHRVLAGMQGRLTEPVYKPAGEDHYRPLSWDEAFAIVGQKLRSLDSPHEAAFYTSGRTSNEAAFLYQLFARGFGTNNLPDCSNMCHESSGWGMGQTIGIGKARSPTTTSRART